jgi:uncharacterized protein
VHALKPEAQLGEVAARYELVRFARPFTLCLKCNFQLQPVDKASVAARVPAPVHALHERFVRCPGCDGVFWPGSHYERMLRALRGCLGQPS